MQKFSLVTSN